MNKKALWGSLFLVSHLLYGVTTWTIIDPSDQTSLAKGTLREAMAKAQSGDIININVASQINLVAPLPAILVDFLTIQSIATDPALIYGAAQYQIFSVAPSSTNNLITFQNMVLNNGRSTGGNGGNGNTSGGGGGGGAGGGGNLYIHTGAKVALINMSLQSGSAIGGNGGNMLTGSSTALNGGGGGGGYGSNASIDQLGTGGDGVGGSVGGGGGGGGGHPGGGNGGGQRSSGSNSPAETGGATWLVSGGGGGGHGNQDGATAVISPDPMVPANAGGADKGGLGGGGAGLGGAGDQGFTGGTGKGGNGGKGVGTDQGFGGGGGGGAMTLGGIGGDGTGAGGGGGAYQSSGGTGGPLGGGGGAGSNGGASPPFPNGCPVGGSGGFGGGGGGGGGPAPVSLFGGGDGGVGTGQTGAPGGGGAGMGGNIFMQSSAQLTIGDPPTGGSPTVPLTGGAATGGSAGTGTPVAADAKPGGPYGQDLFIRSGSTVIFNPTGTLTLTNAIESNQQSGLGGGIVMSGTGFVVLSSSANTYTGSTTINSGTIQIAADGCLGVASNPVTIQNGILQTTASFPSARSFSLTGSPATFNTNSGTTLTLTGPVSGSGILQKTQGAGASAGVLILSGPLSYTGGTKIVGGTLSIQGTSLLPSTGSMQIANTSSATLDIGSGLSQTVGDLLDVSGSGGSIILGANTLTFGTATASRTFSGTISGTGAIVKQGSGIANLNGNSSYSGGTTLKGGTLGIGLNTSLGTAGTALAVTDTATLSVNFDGTMNHPITITANKVFTLNTANTVTISTGIAETAAPASFTKTGAGSLTFSTVANTYTGSTLLQGGSVHLAVLDAIAPSSAVSIVGSTVFLDASQTVKNLIGDAGSTITFTAPSLMFTFRATDPSNSQTFAGVINDGGNAGAAIKQGPGQTIFTGANSYTGGTTISEGTLSLKDSGSLATTGAISVSSGAFFDISLKNSSQTIGDLSGAGTVKLGLNTLTFGTATTPVTFSGVITDGGGITKAGSGEAIFTGANTYTGKTTVSAGQLTLQGSGQLYANEVVGALEVDGTFDITSGLSQTVGDLTGSGQIDLGANKLTFGTSAASQMFSGSISGSGGQIQKQGSGLVILSGSSSYTGVTTLSSGTLSITQNTSIGASGSPMTVAGASTFQINYSTTMDHPITINPGITLTLDSIANTPTISASITGSGSIVKIGDGTVTLSAASNGYTGSTTISVGTLNLTGASSSIPSSPLVTINSGTHLAIGSNQTLNDLSGASGSFIDLGGNELTFGTGNNISVASTISGTGGSLVKQGSGVVSLTGNSSYTGGTTLSSGTLSITGNTSIGASASPMTVTGASIFQINYSDMMDHPIAIDPGITLTLDSLGNTPTISASITQAAPTASIIKIGTGTLTLSAINGYTGSTTISMGTLNLTGASTCIASSSLVSIASGAHLAIGSDQTINDLSGASGSFIDLGANELTFGTGNSTTVAGVISGSGGSIVKDGTGTVSFSAANTYTGGTEIADGTLALIGPNGSLFSSGLVNLSSGTSLFDMSALGGKLRQDIGELMGVSGSQVNLGPHLLVFGGNSGATFSGVITGPGIVTKKGLGTAIFEGANTYFGGTIINNGTLSLQGLSGQLSSIGTVLVRSSTEFDISLSLISPQIIGDLRGAGTVSLGANELQFGTPLNSTFSGTIQGAGSITKVGSGTATFTGTNTFLGGATVNAGTLAVNGSFASGATVNAGTLVVNGSLAGGATVNNAAILKGTGTIAGAVLVNDSGTIRPGNSVGTLTVGSLSLSPMSNTYIEMQPMTASQSSAASSIHVLAAASLDGTCIVDASPGIYPSFTQYTILTADGGRSGMFVSSTPTFTLGSQNLPNAILIYSANTVVLQIGEVPPPAINTDLLDGNHNGQHLADYLNQFGDDPILGPVVFDLSQLSKDQLNAAMNSISPARNAIGRFVGQNTMFLLANTVSCRMAQQRIMLRDLQMRKANVPEQLWVGLAPHGNGAKSSMASFSPSPSLEESFFQRSKSWGAYVEEDPGATDFVSEDNPEFFNSSPRGKTTIAARGENHYALWTEAVGEWIYQGPRHENPSYAAYTGGGLLGFDYYGQEGGLLGFAAGYAKSRIQEGTNAGNIMLDTYMATLYGTIAIGQGYIEVGLAGCWNHFHNKRNVIYPQVVEETTFNEKAVSSCSGAQAVPHLGAGYDWNFWWGTLEPFLAFDCAVLYQSSYTETGAFPLNMHVPPSWSELFRSELGLHAYQLWNTSCGDFVLRETVSYVNKRPYSIGDMFPNIVGYPPGFSLASFTNVQSFFSPGFQFLYRSPYGAFFSLTYMGEFQENNKKKYTSQNVLGQLGIYF